MKKGMPPIEVSTTNDGDILISQDIGNEAEIFVVPEQVPVLIEWLQQAMAEVMRLRTSVETRSDPDDESNSPARERPT